MKAGFPEFVGESLINHAVEADYVDVYSCAAPQGRDCSPDDLAVEVWTVMPRWVGFMFKVRNVLVKPFGLEGGTIDADETERAIRGGGGTEIMSVAAKSPSETVIKFSDSHLDACLSVMLRGGCVHAITAVKFNNLLGKAYFALIWPFHGLIVRSMLGGAVKRLSAGNEKMNKNLPA